MAAANVTLCNLQTESHASRKTLINRVGFVLLDTVIKGTDLVKKYILTFTDFNRKLNHTLHSPTETNRDNKCSVLAG